MIVDSVTSEVASEQCRDLEIAENSPYFTSTENLDKDKVKQVGLYKLKFPLTLTFK